VRRQYETARTRLALLDELLGAAKESRQNGWLVSYTPLAAALLAEAKRSRYAAYVP